MFNGCKPGAILKLARCKREEKDFKKMATRFQQGISFWKIVGFQLLQGARGFSLTLLSANECYFFCNAMSVI